jgi:hypothetical protein
VRRPSHILINDTHGRSQLHIPLAGGRRKGTEVPSGAGPIASRITQTIRTPEATRRTGRRYTPHTVVAAGTRSYRTAGGVGTTDSDLPRSSQHGTCAASRTVPGAPNWEGIGGCVHADAQATGGHPSTHKLLERYTRPVIVHQHVHTIIMTTYTRVNR